MASPKQLSNYPALAKAFAENSIRVGAIALDREHAEHRGRDAEHQQSEDKQQRLAKLAAVGGRLSLSWTGLTWFYPQTQSAFGIAWLLSQTAFYVG